MTIKLDQRLENDNHLLFHWNEMGFLLHKNASIPWLILVPKTQQIELLSLEPKQLQQVLNCSRICQSYLQQQMGAEKINFAAIGNVVSQLHIHIVGRYSKDPCWPDVVWGQSYPHKDYTQTQLDSIKQHLLTHLHS